MASVSIINSFNTIEVTVNQSGCSGVIYTSHKLYQNGSLYDSFNSTGTQHTFVNVPVGFNYYVISDLYVSGPTLCQSVVSNTVTVQSYCIPAGQSNLRFSHLAGFYGLNAFDIRLSGSSNPSSGNNIFGRSTLPSSGNPSKTIPNAVSELRGTCGGITNIFETPGSGDSYFRYTGQLSENLKAGFKVDGSSGIFWPLDPANPGSQFGYCATFSNQHGVIRQSNGTTGVESQGAKTIKIGFSTLSLEFGTTVNVTVKRLSDNVTLASDSVVRPMGSNLYNSIFSTLSWSNASNNTKIGVIVDVFQVCIA